MTSLDETSVIESIATTAEEIGSNSKPEQTSQSCPIATEVVVTTRAGGIPIENARIEVNGEFFANTSGGGIARGDISICDGDASFKVIYQNTTERLKREEFSLALSDIEPKSGTLTIGSARNFIGKVQDVFGSGEEGFPGDKDFIDEYSGEGLACITTESASGSPLLQVEVKMATISLYVPYVNQNDGNEVVGGVTQRGSVLCMPTSGEMLAGYWGIQKVTTNEEGDEECVPLTRLHIMEEARARNMGFSLTSFPRAWQNWATYRETMQTLVDESSPDSYEVSRGAAGGNSAYSIPSDYADGIKDLIAEGIPTVTSTYATNGHVMVVIGAVVKHDDEAEWLIFNDPNGTLASEYSIYDDLDINNAVGTVNDNDEFVNRAEDVRAVQEVLSRLGYYDGELGATIDPLDSQDQTIEAIKAYQGANGDGRIDPDMNTESRLNTDIDKGTSPKYSSKERERNGQTGDLGRHVYYNGDTEGARNGQFRIKGSPWSCVIEPSTPLTLEQIRSLLVQGEQI